MASCRDAESWSPGVRSRCHRCGSAESTARRNGRQTVVDHPFGVGYFRRLLKVPQLHRLNDAIDDHGRSEAGSQPKKEHLSGPVAPKCLHGRIVDDLEAPECGGKIEPNPAASQIMRVCRQAPVENRSRITNRYGVVVPIRNEARGLAEIEPIMSTTSPLISLPQGIAALPAGSTRAMALSALGVVFGDIGTSPLYTITVAETVGVESRGTFYEATGALRDMVPNHVFDLLSMVAMEPPGGFDAAAIRAKKAEVFAAMRPVKVEMAVRGQYGAGTVLGSNVIAYRDEPNVSPRSNIETYVAMQLETVFGA